jgi:hypothetical protein
MRKAAAGLLLVLVVTGCTEQPQCLLEDYRELSREWDADSDRRCIDAIRIAARYTSELRPSQDDVDDRLALLALARSADERFATIHDISPESWDAIDIRTDRPEVTGAWSDGQLQTGSSEVDDLLEAAGADEVEPRSGYFALRFATAVNVPAVVAAFAALGGMAAEVTQGEMDGKQIDLPSESEVRFEIAWGDCFVGCPSRHYWLVSLDRQDGDAVIVEEGGDPIPSGYFD